jgi:uncharacterized protein (DUF2141 family)
MKLKSTLSLSLLLVQLVAAFLPVMADDAPEGDITVAIKGLKNSQGVVRVALFGSKETYNNDHNIGMGSFRKVAVPITDQQATARFTGMPYGDYAIKVFHDENNSGKFATNAFGIPKIEHAVSNNARALFGPPGFDKAKFKLEQANLSMEIRTAGK